MEGSEQRPTTVRQVADALGVSASLVYLLCSAGKLRHERYGVGRGTIRIPADALADYRQAAAEFGPANVIPPLRHLAD